MNIRVGDGTPSPCPLRLLEDPVIVRQTQEAAVAAVVDGYSTIVYNFIREGTTLNPNDTCNFHGFDNLQTIYE